ncbi:MFS transporter [Kocuria sp.]|uniref:MFS transporter n=1 Tax=Kocuria sp. TaxID=1871328 RepID=UPI0026E0BF0B|nr:aromatic acid/H+ symport family MFS transporter [Kocuria sp.]MDO5617471.1 aromatic acid/H+ symport family MFS transporter [Kocuria sp.]
MSTANTLVTADKRLEMKTAIWVAAIACTALIFDGYDLVVYGTVMPTLMNDPSHIGVLDASTAGTVGSLALIGVLLGSFASGFIGDILGRKKMMMFGIAWFSIGMAITAATGTVFTFGLMRFITGLGLGLVIATAGPTIAEFAPKDKRGVFNAIVYSGVPAGGMFASLCGILLAEHIGWRGLFLIGATPILFLVPLAAMKLPESPRWLLSRGQEARAIELARQTGVPLEEELAVRRATTVPKRTGYAALFTREFGVATLLMASMSFAGLFLTYGMNTWLPRIMESYGYAEQKLWFPFVLNGAAVIGGLIAARASDRLGKPQNIIASTFLLAAIALVLMTFQFPLALLFTFIGVAGIGILGTQVLIYGFQSNYFTSDSRAAGVAACATIGRAGGVFGPLIGGWLVAAGLGATQQFHAFAAVALVGAIVTFIVPRKHNTYLIEREAVQRATTQQTTERDREPVV